MTVTKEAIVYRTTDYDLFRHLPGNREVSANRKNMILKSMKEHGVLITPIVVNEQMEVIDGQGRLAALKELNAPVYYYIVKQATAKQCAVLNSASTNWNTDDYIKSYVDQGVKSYERLYDLLNSHPGMRKRDVLGLCSDPIQLGGSSYNRQIKEGEFQLSEERAKVADCIATRAEPLVKIVRGMNTDSMSAVPAVIFIAMQHDADLKRMLRVLERKSYLATNGTTRGAVEVLTELYNYKLGKKKTIDFVSRFDEYKKKTRTSNNHNRRKNGEF